MVSARASAAEKIKISTARNRFIVASPWASGPVTGRGIPANAKLASVRCNAPPNTGLVAQMVSVYGGAQRPATSSSHHHRADGLHSRLTRGAHPPGRFQPFLEEVMLRCFVLRPGMLNPSWPNEAVLVESIPIRYR